METQSKKYPRNPRKYRQTGTCLPNLNNGYGCTYDRNIWGIWLTPALTADFLYNYKHILLLALRASDLAQN